MMAFNINREMINQFNNKVRQTQREKAFEMMVVQQDLMDVTKRHMDSISNRLRVLSNEYKILDFETQVKEAYRGFFSSNATNRMQLDLLISNLEEHGGEYNLLGIQLEQFSVAYATAVTEYEKARIDVEKKLTYSNEIISPYPPDRKSWPVRWLIVLISVAASTFLSFLVIGVVEQLKKIQIHENSEK
jgi:capsule polysaccharide export protein KpsE/RkpR